MLEGLKRRDFSEEQIRAIRNAYRVLYRSELKLEDALTQLRAMAAEHYRDFRRLHLAVDAQPGALSPRVAKPLRIGLVAGEASGDLLGAALITALQQYVVSTKART